MWPRLRRIDARQKLVRARELFQRGEFAEAARVFEELAQEAEGLGMLDRAGDLHLQAARCYLQLDDMERADQAKRNPLGGATLGGVPVLRECGWGCGAWFRRGLRLTRYQLGYGAI